MPLIIQITGTPLKYLNKLDKSTRQRIQDKLTAIASDPTNTRFSYPLEASVKRATRVGKHRIPFTTDATIFTVADIDSRGQVYRNA